MNCCDSKVSAACSTTSPTNPPAPSNGSSVLLPCLPRKTGGLSPRPRLPAPDYKALMLRIAFAFLVATASLLPAAEPHRDAKADEIAHAVMNAMGGEKAWYAAHFVRYDFIVDLGNKVVENRSHLWDKMTGRYRLEDKTKDGKPRVVLFSINDRKGNAYVDGKKLDGPAGAKAVKDAYEAFINDMYWLAMPSKWLHTGE